MLAYQDRRYCGKPIGKDDVLRSFFSTQVVSGCECFDSIAGYETCGISPTVEFINIHLPGETIICVNLTDSTETIENKIEDSMSKLERYFVRLNDVAFDDLTLCEYYSKYRILTENSENSLIDNGNPKRYIVEKKDQSICSIQSVPLLNVELFSLRLLLNAFPYRSFDDIFIYEDKQYISFNEIAIARDLLINGDEFKISLEEAIKFNRPPSELRFLLVLLCKQGAKLEELLNLFKDQVSSDLNSSDSYIFLKEMLNLYNKMNLGIPKILEPYVENDYNAMNNQNIGNEINDLSFSFNDEQQYVIDAYYNKYK